MGPADYIAAGAALGMFLLTGGGIIWSHGRHAQRIESAEGDIKALEGRVTGLEQLKVSVEGLTQSVEHLGERMTDSQKLSASELGRLADSVAAGQKLVETQLAGFRDLTDSRLAEVTDSVRAIRNRLDEQRSFAPARQTSRRKGAP